MESFAELENENEEPPDHHLLEANGGIMLWLLVAQLVALLRSRAARRLNASTL